jgi:hypothetical protein
MALSWLLETKKICERQRQRGQMSSLAAAAAALSSTRPLLQSSPRQSQRERLVSRREGNQGDAWEKLKLKLRQQ